MFGATTGVGAGAPPSNPAALSESNRELVGGGAAAGTGVAFDTAGVLGFKRDMICAIDTDGAG